MLFVAIKQTLLDSSNAIFELFLYLDFIKPLESFAYFAKQSTVFESKIVPSSKLIKYLSLLSNTIEAASMFVIILPLKMEIISSL